MRAWALVCAVGLLVSASTAWSAGINMAWDDCGIDGGAQNKDFACATNAGASVVVCSFEPSQTNDANTVGLELVIDVEPAAPELPTWWSFNGAGANCRGTALSGNTTLPTTALSCVDTFEGFALSTIAYDFITGTPRARIRMAVAVAPDHKASTSPGHEYFAGALVLSNKGTLGTECSGCATPMCLGCNQLRVYAGDGSSFEFLGGPLARNWVGWQGRSVVTCPSEVPVRARTWGAIKSQYR